MNRLQTIENSLISINETVFQELCDSFLVLRNENYRIFSRTGSQTGKQKTTKGTPDTFLILPNGKYIFVEYSTNITGGISKLEADINKCINSTKTGIPLNEIDEIIICINFPLKAAEINALKNILSNTQIELTVYTLDALALELHLNHRDLAHRYLGLPLDTGQIVSIDRFIEEYNQASKRISTPLNNPFLYREEELNEIKELINQKDFIILCGAPGVGKTKLAIEAINNFLMDNASYDAYCVSYKHCSLLEDLYQYFKKDKNYVLFIDDANRIDAFSQITSFYKTDRRGNLKLIITVRDYAFQTVKMLCQEFYPSSVNLSKFTDEQIINIVKGDPFQIINSRYHPEIVRIANGNPRLAIMAALLANAKQDIYALSDVSDLFEQYFSTYVKDNGELENAAIMKTLGLISFFFAIPYKDKEIATDLLQSFKMDYDSFIDTIEKLDRLELVEIQHEYVKIPEQNLATYFFYKAFVKNKFLSFETLLDKYFDENIGRFKDCVIPANNTFGYKNVMEKFYPDLLTYWNKIKKSKDEDKCFKFLSSFWFYMQNETLEFIYNLIRILPTKETSSYNVKYKENDFAYRKNRTIDLISDFFHFEKNLRDSLELVFEYVRKEPANLPELIYNIRQYLTFDWEDEQSEFSRQNILFQILVEGLNKKDLLYSIAFYELSKTFLSFKYRQAKGGRRNSITFYDYPIPDNICIRNFRKRVWINIYDNFERFPDLSFDILKSYSQRSPDVIEEIMKYDLPFLIKIIKAHLTANSFEHCRYVQEQIRWCKRNKINHPIFDSLTLEFTNKLYVMSVKLDWDRLRDKESYEYENHSEYEKLKESDIRNSFTINNTADINNFLENFIYLKKVAKNAWSFNNSFDIIVDEICNRNFELGCQFLVQIIEKSNPISYEPRIVFQNHLTTLHKSQYIWNILQNHSFKDKEIWELSFFNNLADVLINKEYAQAITDTIKSLKGKNSISFSGLERYLEVRPNLFEEILTITSVINDAEKGSVFIWNAFREKYFEKLGDNIELIKKVYIQQREFKMHFDYDKSELLLILKKDPTFILKYIQNPDNEELSGYSGSDHELGIIWNIDNIESVLVRAFDLLNEKLLYFGISEHFYNSFFYTLREDKKERAQAFLLEYCRNNYSDHRKINIVVDITRHSMRYLFEKVLLLFLSLTQEEKIFSKIWWIGNGGTLVSGDVIIGDIKATEWRNILSIVEKSDVGFKLIPIKRYINEKITSALKYGDAERRDKFLERY